MATQIGMNEKFKYCIRDNEVYCSTLCRNGKFDRSPLDEEVKAFDSYEHALNHIKNKRILGHVVIPYKEWE